ncbi:alkyl/aryl-sulfatase [Pseudomonas sp. NPDC086251]|uniref:alkyl/aryl-sulfatase n=1 Tax=Pseudomonas sp. NPDC086251 TaxID=3364431 RepID=UPI0038386ADF
MFSKTLKIALIMTFGSGLCPAVFAAGAIATSGDPVSTPDAHFDSKGKAPSSYTIEQQNALRQSLPFADQRDLAEAKKGFIAAPPYKQIMADAGNVAWNMGSYDFLLDGKDYNSINPSLQRQAVLNMAYGLYEVVPDKIYQVRGFDLANITFIKGETGWIVFDTLTSRETAKAALDFVNQTLGKRPVVAVVFSHSHADHFGGIRGVVDEADVRSGKVALIAPKGFMEHAVAENVYAGNAMNRRAFFQYGMLLPHSPYGHVDMAIGKNTAIGDLGLIEPNRYIDKEFESLTIDGVQMEFQNTPGTEAPSEMNTWFPQFKAFWAAENITGTIHNIYTLRGALVRDPLVWSKNINNALYRYGQQAEVMLAAHSWPRWGSERIQEVMRAQRDTYANLNNAVLHAANQGVTINEIHNVYKLPDSLKNNWATHSYHGSEEHNSRAVINRYLGYWDANPATLMPLSPKDSAPLYVEMMGGAQKILAKGQSLFDQGKYREAYEILNKLVYAEPQNSQAKDLLADVYEQVGYQKESAGVRNSFLAAAYELRHGMPQGVPPNSAGPDIIRAMSTELWLEDLGIRLDGSKVANEHFVLNLKTPDNGEQFVVELSNSTLTSIKGQQAKNPDISITLNRSALEALMANKTSFKQLVADGKLQVEGDRRHLLVMDAITPFTPAFELLPGTR